MMSTHLRRADGLIARDVVGELVDLIQKIQAFDRGRDPRGLALKYEAMRASPFAFPRGSCHLFYDRLPRGGVFKSAPTVWSCGDLHLKNFGSFKADNGLVYFDISDLDEAVPAPASSKVVRMLSSVRVAADDVTLRAADAEALCALFVDSYALALARSDARGFNAAYDAGALDG